MIDPGARGDVAPSRVLIVDDHPLVRLGLETRINAQSDLAVCGQAATTGEALALARALQPALIIVDIALKDGDGIDLIKRLRASGIESRIIAFSAHDERLFGERALRAGAQGYVSKQEGAELLLDAIRTVLRGQVFLSPALTQSVAAHWTRGASPAHGIDALSDRELQVLSLIGTGRTTRAIADQLHISLHTVESHREKLRAKLNLANGAELARYAAQWMLAGREK